MAAETRIKLANIITRLPEEAVDSLYETACKMFENHPDDEKPCCPSSVTFLSWTELNETVSIPQLSWGNNRCKWR
ncbi:MAG: hypothetical protein HFI58_12205 [Lachnospiraceae bacterium]|nr:hypothetical protein [Lachnospiraceae bacterium]